MSDDDNTNAWAIEQAAVDALKSMEMPTPDCQSAMLEIAIVNLRIDGGLLEVELAVVDDGQSLRVEQVELFPESEGWR